MNIYRDNRLRDNRLRYNSYNQNIMYFYNPPLYRTTYTEHDRNSISYNEHLYKMYNLNLVKYDMLNTSTTNSIINTKSDILKNSQYLSVHYDNLSKNYDSLSKSYEHLSRSYDSLSTTMLNKETVGLITENMENDLNVKKRETNLTMPSKQEIDDDKKDIVIEKPNITENINTNILEEINIGNVLIETKETQTENIEILTGDMEMGAIVEIETVQQQQLNLEEMPNNEERQNRSINNIEEGGNQRNQISENLINTIRNTMPQLIQNVLNNREETRGQVFIETLIRPNTSELLFNVYNRNTYNTEPITNGLKLDEIRNNTEVLLYSNIKTDEEICAICNENYAEDTIMRRINKCGHFCCLTCLDKWFVDNDSCPHCKQLVIDDTIEETELDEMNVELEQRRTTPLDEPMDIIMD